MWEIGAAEMNKMRRRKTFFSSRTFRFRAKREGARPRRQLGKNLRISGGGSLLRACESRLPPMRRSVLPTAALGCAGAALEPVAFHRAIAQFARGRAMGSSRRAAADARAVAAQQPL